jgi:hypothetical protein
MRLGQELLYSRRRKTKTFSVQQVRTSATLASGTESEAYELSVFFAEGGDSSGTRLINISFLQRAFRTRQSASHPSRPLGSPRQPQFPGDAAGASDDHH